MHLYRPLFAASLLVPAALFAAVAAHNRADVLRDGQSEIVRSTAVMHEHAQKVFETAELALARVDDHLRALASAGGVVGPETGAFLVRLKAPLEQAVSIWIADADGTFRAATHAWTAQAGSVAGREYFEAQRERDAGGYVSAPFLGRTTARPSFALSRRRPAPDGRFAGTVHVSLSPEYFARFYAEAAPDLPGASGALVRADGEVLVREPFREATRRLGPDNPLMREIADRPEGGFASGVSSVDGRERMFAYRKVAGYPLYVVSAAETAAVLRRWHENLALFGAAAGAASLALMLLSWLVVRGLRAERAALDELRREVARREAAEGRVRQAQRMEAVGQLTAGVAHDFNNLLTAVMGSLGMLRGRLPEGDQRAVRLLDTAVQGARRGASLVQSLLAFGRNQRLTPEAVDVPDLVRGMSELLRTSLGGGVRIETRFPAVLAPARVDAGQLEMALLNLAVNARDAMSGAPLGATPGEPRGSTPGGVLTVSAREERVRVERDGQPAPSASRDRFAWGRSAALPSRGRGSAASLASDGSLRDPSGDAAPRDGSLRDGDYVVLSVADTGAGMDEATLARCTEPFFTTKGIGEGSGLGLSMVHGLAAQSGGRLVLVSRRGEGTTAEIWLPRAEVDAVHAPLTARP